MNTLFSAKVQRVSVSQGFFQLSLHTFFFSEPYTDQELYIILESNVGGLFIKSDGTTPTQT